MDVEVLTVTYASFDDLLRDLRQGGQLRHGDRRRGLSGRSAWQAARDAYEKLRHDGRPPATLEVVYGHVFGKRQRRLTPTADLSFVSIPSNDFVGADHERGILVKKLTAKMKAQRFAKVETGCFFALFASLRLCGEMAFVNLRRSCVLALPLFF